MNVVCLSEICVHPGSAENVPCQQRERTPRVDSGLYWTEDEYFRLCTADVSIHSPNTL